MVNNILGEGLKLGADRMEICKLHINQLNDQGECLGCLAGSPPDLGVAVEEEIKTDEHFG